MAIFCCGLSVFSWSQSALDKLAVQYVKLGLHIGQYDGDFVDAYYGPDSLKPNSSKADQFPAEAFLRKIKSLRQKIKQAVSGKATTEELNRAGWMDDQLRAFAERVRMFKGQYHDFDTEAYELFGVIVPHHTESYFKNELEKLDKILPGKGTVAERFQQLANRFIVPPDKLDTVFKTAIHYSRKITKEHFVLPESEHCSLEFVKDKPWSGYNWYQGNYFSKVEINMDVNIFIERVVDVASHESYPGHHVYNLLLEENLYRRKHYVEVSLYPLFSPQSLIAEGSANYGVGLVFPEEERLKFCKEVLLPISGLDTLGLSTYFTALDLRDKLNYARNEVARQFLNGKMTEEEGLHWLQDYCLMSREGAKKSISFIKKYRSYVINYNFGKDLVKRFVESGNKNREGYWKKFGFLLSHEIRIKNLEKDLSH